MDKNELARTIREHDGLSNEVKTELLKLLQEQKRYGLVWEEKTEDIYERLREDLPVLIERDDEKVHPVISANPNAPNHLIIEGDNLAALTELSYTHAGKIDVIYIDPPYNTGNKDFVYNDRYVDKEDSYRHSKWLSFMSSRLRIAKGLLSECGVIFISIDDNEQANLKLLCDEIYGENNFIAKFDWRKKTGANDAKDIAVITESVICFSKNKLSAIQTGIWNRDRLSRNDNRFKYSDEYVSVRGKYYLDTLDRGGLQYSDTLNFGVEAPDGGIIFPHGRDKYVNDGWIWKWSKSKIDWGIKNGFIEFVKSKKSRGSEYTIKYKVYELVDNEGNPKSQIGRAFSNLIIEPINQQGNSDISNVFDGLVPFSNPKPIGLIKYLLNTLKEETILDFFAGSGTTLHATMQLNAEDGGHRTCILCTNNENNICEDITYERNKRVIEGYTIPKGERVEGLQDNNLRYYRTEFIPRERTVENMRKLMNASTGLLCIKNDLYTEAPFGGKKMKSEYARYFEKDGKRMLIIYDERAIPVIVNIIKGMPKGEEKIKVYVFSHGSYAYNDEFEEVEDKVTLTALPQAIYDAYKNALPPQKIKYIDEERDGEEMEDNISDPQMSLDFYFEEDMISEKGGEE